MREGLGVSFLAHLEGTPTKDTPTKRVLTFAC